MTNEDILIVISENYLTNSDQDIYGPRLFKTAAIAASRTCI